MFSIPANPISLPNGCKVDFSVLMKACLDLQRISIIKDLCSAGDLGLKDAKDLIDACTTFTPDGHQAQSVNQEKVYNVFCDAIRKRWGNIYELESADDNDTRFHKAMCKAREDWRDYGFKSYFDFVRILVQNFERE